MQDIQIERVSAEQAVGQVAALVGTTFMYKVLTA